MFFWALLLLAIPFGLPLYSLISQSLIRARMTRLEETLEAQNDAIEALERRLRLLSEPKKEPPSEVVRPAGRRAGRAAAGADRHTARRRAPGTSATAGARAATAGTSRRHRRGLRGRRFLRSPRRPRHHCAVRLGKPGRREALLRDRRDRARARRGLLPQVFDGPRLARAAGPRRHRHHRRDRAARDVRADGGAPLSGDRQRARRRGDCDPLRDLLRGPRPVAPDPGRRRVRAAGPRHRRGCAAVDPARLALHRGARSARRLFDSGAAVHRREPADPALRLPASAERRPGVGRVEEEVAGTHGPDAGADGDLPVGLGHQVPLVQPAAAGDGHLPDLRDRFVRGADARARRLRRWTSRWSGPGSARRRCRWSSRSTWPRCPRTARARDCCSGSCCCSTPRCWRCRWGAETATTTGCTRSAAAPRCSCSRSGSPCRTRAARGSRSRCSRPPAAPSTRWRRWPAILPAVRSPAPARRRSTRRRSSCSCSR